MIIGLTGGIGSGKTTVAEIFAEKPDVVVYIADQRAKWIMNNSEKVKKELILNFGDNAFLNGEINRDFLSKIVFNNPEKLKLLNEIVHPAVREDFSVFAQKHKAYIIIYEAAILFETNSQDKFDFIIHVYTPQEIRIQRVKKRDKLTEEDILQRIKNQWSDSKKNLQSHYVILNQDITETATQIQNIYNILTKKSRSI